MSVTYIDAIHDAQKDLLAEDKDVFLYGQDIGCLLYTSPSPRDCS